jgi:glycine hydroxymethyltransferase
MQTIGGWMLEALRAADDGQAHERIREQVRELCSEFPVPAAALETTAT